MIQIDKFMKFLPIKTRAMLPPKDDLYDLLDHDLPRLKENDILFITSKIVAIHQGRCVKIEPGVNKDDLIKKEAEKYIPRVKIPKNFVILTLKNHTLIPSSGIDKSNGNGYYILWPKHINSEAQTICKYLKKKHNIKKLGVVITDSHTIPLRYGVLGISIGFFGLKPLIDYRGHLDIFGEKLWITRANIVDSFAATAVLLMGESAEQTPLLILRNAPLVKFTNQPSQHQLVIPQNQDIYRPLLKAFRSRKLDKQTKTK